MKSKDRSKRVFRVAAGLALAFLQLRTPPAAAASDREILPLSAVKAGMKGHGLTVVSGDKIERFEVEVIGVLRDQPPGRSSILVRVAGLGLEHSGIVAGMSGSPVFFDGKVAGALAATWAFSKDPVGLVTPIESMLEIDPARLGQPGAGAPMVPTSTAVSQVLGRGTSLQTLLSMPEDERITAMRQGLEKTLPLSLSGGHSSLLASVAAGFPSSTLERFADFFPRLGLHGVGAGSLSISSQAAQAGPPPGIGPSQLQGPPLAPLAEGSAVTALLIEGDIQLGATGTVTYVSSDGRFFAFGHPFLSFGELALPVAPARVVSVIASQYQSFKVVEPAKAVYRLTRDRDTAISGRTDRSSPMVPVRLRFESPDVAPRELNLGLAPHSRLLPVLVAMASDAALTQLDPTPRERTLHYSVSLETSGGTIRYEDESTGARAKDLAILTAATLTGLVADNDMQDPRVSRIDLSFRSEPGERRLRVVDAALSARKVAPGSTISALVRLADRRGTQSTRVVTLRVPKEAPEGRATLVVADGTNASTLRFALDPAEPRTLKEFGRFVSRLVPGNRLAVSLIVPSRGIATGSETLSSVPPTMVTLLAGGLPDPSESARANVGGRLLAEEIQTLDRPVAGFVRLELEIERPRS